jgi:hypothetical protein
MWSSPTLGGFYIDRPIRLWIWGLRVGAEKGVRLLEEKGDKNQDVFVTALLRVGDAGGVLEG